MFNKMQQHTVSATQIFDNLFSNAIKKTTRAIYSDTMLYEAIVNFPFHSPAETEGESAYILKF